MTINRQQRRRMTSVHQHTRRKVEQAIKLLRMPFMLGYTGPVHAVVGTETGPSDGKEGVDYIARTSALISPCSVQACGKAFHASEMKAFCWFKAKPFAIGRFGNVVFYFFHQAGVTDEELMEYFASKGVLITIDQDQIQRAWETMVETVEKSAEATLSCRDGKVISHMLSWSNDMFLESHAVRGRPFRMNAYISNVDALKQLPERVVRVVKTDEAGKLAWDFLTAVAKGIDFAKIGDVK